MGMIHQGIKKLLITIFLMVFSQSLMAARTAIFTDSQFTSNPAFGKAMARKCLNPQDIPDASVVNIRGIPGGSPKHLVNRQKICVKSGCANVWENNVISKQSVGDYINTGSLYAKPYFDEQVGSSDVNRVMIIMGINNISYPNNEFDLNHWDTVIEKIQEGPNPKQCVIGLPPLVDHAGWNRLIVAHNRALVDKIKNYNCQIVDTSNTLTLGEKGQQFQTIQRDNYHFSSQAADSLSSAMCAAFLENQSTTVDIPEFTVNPADETEFPDLWTINQNDDGLNEDSFGNEILSGENANGLDDVDFPAGAIW